MSAASGKPAIVAYAATGGTAVSGRDYTLKDGTLVFEPGETIKSIDIGIIDNKLYEDNRTIEVTLSNPSTPSWANRRSIPIRSSTTTPSLR